MAQTNRLVAAVDWFVPAELRESTATLWQGRIFVISHFFGPFSAVAILGYLYRVLDAHDWVFWTLCALCGSFWLLPFALRWSGQSVQARPLFLLRPDRHQRFRVVFITAG